ncbi:AGE family epimerase/isomerase [Tessaracoccus coleopterorum]|uniref:AGE family epimerase/isomerase n=1 Tax=Tessaracoccus coleopterorum TaxID=2714950 RepID=UPI0038CD95F5
MEPAARLQPRRPHHPFRPFGSQPGHWLEWAKLLMQMKGSGRGRLDGHCRGQALRRRLRRRMAARVRLHGRLGRHPGGA